MGNFKFDPSEHHNDFMMWLVCEAMGNDIPKPNKDGNSLEIGGAKHDFEKFVKRLEETINDMISKKAQELLHSKYQSVIDDIEKIQYKISEQDKLFEFPWNKN